MNRFFRMNRMWIRGEGMGGGMAEGEGIMLGGRSWGRRMRRLGLGWAKLQSMPPCIIDSLASLNPDLFRFRARRGFAFTTSRMSLPASLPGNPTSCNTSKLP